MDILDALIKSGSVLFGDFTLKDGTKSNIFIDVGQITQPWDLPMLRDSGFVLHDKDFKIDVIVGIPYKGIPLAYMLSDITGKPYDYYRKDYKTYGELGTFITKEMKPGMNVVIVDDVLTSGSSKQEALRMIKLRGGNPAAIMVIVDRTNGRIKQVDDIPIFSLTTLSDIERRCKEKQI